MSETMKLGLTMYSFSNEYVSGQMDIEQILRTAKAQGYTGVEFIPAQMAPEYPNLTDEWLAWLKNLLAEIGLTPVCWSAYVDMGIRTDRDLTQDEIRQYTINDLIWAKKAGFPIVRSQHSISPEIFAEMIPLCRALNMKLTLEMHHPHHPLVPRWQEYIALMQGEGKGVLGLVPDMSIFQNMPHKLWVREALDAGCRRETMDRMLELHARGAASDTVLSGDYTETEAFYARQLEEEYDAPASIEQFRDLMDCVFYIHGKFYYIDENLHEDAIPYETILPKLAEYGYTGYVACEYEGHHFNTTISAVEQLDRYVHMVQKILGGVSR